MFRPDDFYFNFPNMDFIVEFARVFEFYRIYKNTIMVYDSNVSYDAAIYGKCASAEVSFYENGVVIVVYCGGPLCVRSIDFADPDCCPEFVREFIFSRGVGV